MAPIESFDVIIVGAGIAGISCARTYLKVQKDVKLLILDSSSSPGGTWARDRLYPGLKTNNLCPDFEFPDIPITDHGVGKNEYIPGEVVCRYLEHVSKVTGCTERTWFNVKVIEAIEEDGWQLDVENQTSTHMKLHCKKLVIATGRTNEPAIPLFPGRDMFGKPNVPFKDLSKTSVREQVLGPKVDNVTIIGSSKSGFDAVWLAAESGKSVNWIIRPTGFGVGWFLSSARKIGSFVIRKETIAGIRFLSLLSPSIWDKSDPKKRRWFQTSSIGQWMIRKFMAVLHRMAIAEYDLKHHPERESLVPNMNMYWKGASLAARNYEGDFWEYIDSGRVKIHKTDVTSLDKNGVIHLSNGSQLETDALITCTGWIRRSTISIPSLKDTTFNEASADIAPDVDRIRAAESILYARFPILRSKPPGPKSPGGLPSSSPYFENVVGMPYRGIAPLSNMLEGKRNIVFVGWATSSSAMWASYIASLWAVAYLTSGPDELSKGNLRRGKFSLNPEKKSQSELEFDSLVEARWCALRAPGSPTNTSFDIVLDKLAYFDTLLSDLGLNMYRKRTGWFSWLKEWFVPYTLHDYKDIVEEWISGSL